MSSKLLFIIVLLVSTLARAQQCSETVCLAFNGNECAFCNNYLGYIGDGDGGCVFASSEHCQRVDEGGHCVLCDDGFVAFGAGCRAVPDVDCKEFNSDNTCRLCPVDKAPIPNIDLPTTPVLTTYCENVASLKDNCQYYSSQTACLYCAVGYHPDGSGDCAADIPKCLVSTDSLCSGCPATYALVTPVGDAKTVSFALSLAEAYQTTIVVSSRCVPTKPLGYSFTAPAADANCANSNPDGSCAQCSAGHVLDATGACSGPQTGVEGCAVYSAVTVCASCAAGLYPSADGSKCEPYIKNCKYYSGSHDCLYCEPDFYRASATSCQPSADIADCEVMKDQSNCKYCTLPKISADTSCESAVMTFTTAFGDNCVSYDTKGCTFCSGANYLDEANKKCVATSAIANCASYSAANTCLYCKNPYFLTNNACVYGWISNCEVYEETTAGAVTLCRYCATTHYISTDKKSCIKRTQNDIDDCVYYDNLQRCLVCSPTHSAVSSRKQCVTPGKNANCFNYLNPELCSLCDT